MKKILFVLLSAFMISNATAQETRLAPIAFLNFSGICGDFASSFETRTDFAVGAVIQLMLDDQFRLQSGLIYSRQGADYEDIFEDGEFSETYTGSFKLGYLNVPVLAQYEVVKGLTLEAGPQVGFLLSAKDEYESNGFSGEDDVKDSVKGVDFAASFGVGYTFDNGINISARYNLGLTDIIDDEEVSDMGAKWRNNVFQFGLAYYFNLGAGADND